MSALRFVAWGMVVVDHTTSLVDRRELIEHITTDAMRLGYGIKFIKDWPTHPSIRCYIWDTKTDVFVSQGTLKNMCRVMLGKEE